MLHLLQPRDQIFLKGYGFLFFIENMGKNKSKNLSGKKKKKLLDIATRSARDAFKTASKRAI